MNIAHEEFALSKFPSEKMNHCYTLKLAFFAKPSDSELHDWIIENGSLHVELWPLHVCAAGMGGKPFLALPFARRRLRARAPAHVCTRPTVWAPARPCKRPPAHAHARSPSRSAVHTCPHVRGHEPACVCVHARPCVLVHIPS